MLLIKIFKLDGINQEEVNKFIAEHDVAPDMTTTDSHLVMFYHEDRPMGVNKDGMLNYYRAELTKTQTERLHDEQDLRYWEIFQDNKEPKSGDPSSAEALTNYTAAKTNIRIRDLRIKILKDIVADVENDKFIV